MAVTTASFRASFPVFASAVTYPDAMVAMWLAVAVQSVNPARWSTLADLGVSLYTAHELTIEGMIAKQAQRGVAPTGRQGIQTSKSADGVSVSYDVSTTSEKDAGHWNTTVYGTRYYRMARMMGAGPIQVGADPAQSISAFAWAGPQLKV